MGWTGHFEYKIESCCSCGMYFGMTAEFQKQKLEDRKMFYCPAGHPQHYTGKSNEQRLQASLNKETNRRISAEACCNSTERSLRSTKGVVTKLKNKMEAMNE